MPRDDSDTKAAIIYVAYFKIKRLVDVKGRNCRQRDRRRGSKLRNLLRDVRIITPTPRKRSELRFKVRLFISMGDRKVGKLTGLCVVLRNKVASSKEK